MKNIKEALQWCVAHEARLPVTCQSESGGAVVWITSTAGNSNFRKIVTPEMALSAFDLIVIEVVAGLKAYIESQTPSGDGQ